MYQLNHILVCLDLTDMDDFLIRYSNFMVQKFKPQSITFMHVVRSYDISPDILSSFPGMDKPVKEIVKDEIHDKVERLFEHQNDQETIIAIEEGYTTETTINYTRKHNITLTLMGKKIGYKGRGGVVRKVLSVTPSSVLLVSETTQHKIDHLLVRMDFTKITGIAMKMAMNVKETTGARVSCHHVHKLPLRYFPQNSKESEQKLREHIDKHVQKEYKKFLQKLEIDQTSIPCTWSLDEENDEAHLLYNEALNTQADMILIGSKIKSDLADVILENTSEKLAGFEKNIAVFVVKDRKQTLGFLETLFD